MQRIFNGIDAIATQSHASHHVECQTPGGWEGWLQVELHKWLLQQTTINQAIGREVHCYAHPNTAQKCDLTLGSMAVELKAMGLTRPSAGFVGLVNADIIKITQALVHPTTSAHLAVVIPNAPNSLGIQCATAKNTVSGLFGAHSAPTNCGCYQVITFL